MNYRWTKDEIRLTRFAWELRDRMEFRRRMVRERIAVCASLAVGTLCVAFAPSEGFLVMIALPFVSWAIAQVL